jgi:hypothetical protein
MKQAKTGMKYGGVAITNVEQCIWNWIVTPNFESCFKMR